MKKLACASLFCWIGLGATALALDSAGTITQYIHEVWQTDQGLPQNSVVAIVQSRDGYLWLATQEGLVRFDGIRFSVFDKRSNPEIKENNIQALLEDHDGNLWFGTEGGGLGRFKDGSFTIFTSKDGLADGIVDAIFEDRKGSLWVGTLGGLSRFADGQFTTYSTKDGLASNSVLSICEDRQGNLWIGTEEGGISRMTDGRFTRFTTSDGLASNLVRAIIEDRAGDLWIATGDGLNRFKDDRFITYKARDGLANNSVLSLLEDREGNIWIGTAGGLNRFSNGRFARYRDKDSLSTFRVASICEDREGSLWIGTYEGGLNRLKSGRFTTYTGEDGLADNIVRPVYQDRTGGLWLGTARGLSRFVDGRFTTYTKANGLADNSVLSLSEDSQGGLWVGTNDGLSCFKSGRFISYSAKDGLSNSTVLSICPDRAGGVWFGTDSGLNRLSGGKFTAYTTKDGLTNDSVWALAEDRDGAVWIGTDGGGLNRWKDGVFSAYTTSDGLANNIVLSLYEDREGTLWIGTSGGISRLKDRRLSSYTTRDGLFDDVVFQILEDSKENLWMSCNKGIFRIAKNDFEEHSRGMRASITSISYGRSDGMKSRECNGGFQPAGWKTKDGKLWFPTVKGVVMIDPENIRLNDQPPPVIVERVLVDNEPIRLTGDISLGPGLEKFEFHYTGLSFLAPEKVNFKYKLEGFDRDWVDAGMRREASYTNIPPGMYTFRVVASNNDGIWNMTGASLEFYLKPRFHQTYWFYGLSAVGVALVGWGLHRFRLRQMQARFAAVLAERNRMAREIHDTLAQGFAGISAQLESMTDMIVDSPEAKDHLDCARRLARSSLAEARRSVWNLRSQALENGDLPGALSVIAQQLTAGTGVQAGLEVHGAAQRLPEAIENNLLGIGREALINALKHARASRVLIELSFDLQQVRLRVEDDGCGFDTEAISSTARGGFGLIGMRERSEQIGGELILESKLGQGTQVSVTVPKGRNHELHQSHE
ncbi:MAG TPA: two-component regulator propeller domain-containing protein [Blastocatellia bacterium]|nr:two-component regulator propeller domain-containing protein [Blastocatellia bacterium]